MFNKKPRRAQGRGTFHLTTYPIDLRGRGMTPTKKTVGTSRGLQKIPRTLQGIPCFSNTQGPQELLTKGSFLLEFFHVCT